MVEAMMEEYQNNVWDIVPKQESKSAVSSKLIFKIKLATDGSKAIFVAIGFSQEEVINYEETFSPLARYTSIRTIMVLISMMKWDLHQMDVKKTFLNGMIEEEVYIKQPQGFEVENRATHVCKLKRIYMD